MNILQALILGIIEGFTEFLPISSTGHLSIAEKLMGFKLDDPSVTAFTAIIQIGAVLATLIYFRKDIADIVSAWVRGIFVKSERSDRNYRFGWAIILGSIPIAIAGLLFKHQIETTLRSLWLVAGALLVWSVVMWLADRYASQNRHESKIGWKDTLIVGLAQCLALIPGVSRSGATMSIGMFRGLDRVAVTRLSFFLAIPALVAAGLLEAADSYDKISSGVGWGSTLAATAASFVVAYISISWLLKFVAKHTFQLFVVYRVALGLLLLVLLSVGALSAT